MSDVVIEHEVTERKPRAVAQRIEAPSVSDNLPAPMTPMDMLGRAVASGATMDVLEKLMGLQERYEANQARKAFDAAVANAKAELKPVLKTREGHNGKYEDFAAIANAVDPTLGKYGLSYRFRAAQAERISVTCILSHKDGHSEDTTLSGPADTSGNKNAIQAIGSTLTYLQRYSLKAALGLAATHDDDSKAGGQGETVSEEQVETIQSLIVEVAADIPKFCKYMKVERIEDIPAKQYQRAIAALEGKRAKP